MKKMMTCEMVSFGRARRSGDLVVARAMLEKRLQPGARLSQHTLVSMRNPAETILERLRFGDRIRVTGCYLDSGSAPPPVFHIQRAELVA
jgi:hypothetical protein